MKSRNSGRIFLSTGLVVLAIVTAPFLANWLEKRNETEEQPSVRLADLKTGTFVEVVLPSSRVFVLRDFDDQVYAFSVPYSEAAYWLPEFDWSHPAVPCAEFAPDNKEGMLIKDGAFRCHLPDHGEFFRYEHSWAYSGKNLGYRTADMKIAASETRDGAIFLTQWK